MVERLGVEVRGGRSKIGANRLYKIYIKKGKQGDPRFFTHSELHSAIERQGIPEGEQIGCAWLKVQLRNNKIKIPYFFPFSPSSKEKKKYPLKGHGISQFFQKHIMQDLLPEHKGFEIRFAKAVSPELQAHLRSLSIDPFAWHRVEDYLAKLEAKHA